MEVHCTDILVFVIYIYIQGQMLSYTVPTTGFFLYLYDSHHIEGKTAIEYANARKFYASKGTMRTSMLITIVQA